MTTATRRTRLPLPVKGHGLGFGYRPDSVLEAGQEAGGDAESRVQEVFFLWRLQSPQIGVELL